MHHLLCPSLLALAMSAASSSLALAGGTTSTTQPATPSPVGIRWDAGLYHYEKPGDWVVEETTPTADQLRLHGRPPVMPDPAPPLAAPTGEAVAPARIGKLNVTHLRFRDATGEVVPALLCKPAGNGPFPVVIAVHGLGSNKAQVLSEVAPPLAKRGFAVIAADMPRHGERPGDPHHILEPKNFGERFALMRQAVIDVRQCIDLAERRPDLDTRRGVILVGYSMGSWINAVAGAADPRVKGMALMVGGATDIPPAALLFPQLAAIDPRLAIAHFAGRPLLMLNGKVDPIVTGDMSRRLYAAAPEPKEQRWYDSGHHLPQQAFDDAALWVAETWQKLSAAEPQTAR